MLKRLIGALKTTTNDEAFQKELDDILAELETRKRFTKPWAYRILDAINKGLYELMKHELMAHVLELIKNIKL